jgi:hypothetical protein
MKKIGVMTFSNAVDNYGQVLQYLATQEYLRMLGYYAALLLPIGHRLRRIDIWKYRLRRIKDIIVKYFFKNEPNTVIEPASLDELTRLKMSEFKRWDDSIERNEIIHPRFFNDFKHRYFNIFRGTYEDILEHGFTSFCVGSDQTWSCGDSYYLFKWVPKKLKRFSIAPSVGHWQFKDCELAAYRSELPKFKFVTVREDNGLELCRRCGRVDAKRVLDPTFLLSADYYNKFSTLVASSKPYALLYMLGGEIATNISDIIKYCKSRGLEVKYIASQGREDSFEKTYAGVGEWLSLIRDSEYVFTNSFHGMAFSIIYRKRFLTFPLTGIMSGMNGRINGLAEQMCLKDRLYVNDLSVIEKQIDWSRADAVVGDNRKILDELMKGISR